MADATSLELTPQHPPQSRAIEAFDSLSPTIKREIVKSRRSWDAHEPRMYARVAEVTDEDLVRFDIAKDLVAVRAGRVTYGTIIFGKIRLPHAGDDAFIHVRIHDPPDEERSSTDAVFHSLFTDEKRQGSSDQPTSYNAILREADPIEFFSE